ncbi:MAG TPA: acyltransferase family protein [Candidatus Dormibacteraeota bacterium]|nr:acyltransferase family protein [Candidatus Dormibacteraeota bacterium]
MAGPRASPGRGTPAGASTSRPPTEHVVYLDWLKFLVVYGIIVYHSSLPFAYGGGWLIASRDKSLVLTAFAGFTFPWGIPLLFLLSGAGAYFGLRTKAASAFLRKRIIRLGLPLVAGIILLSPLQSYLTGGIVPKTVGGMLGYYPHFLGSMRFDWTPQWLGRYGYHLWFLGYLLAITAATLPLLEWLRGERGRRWISRLARTSRTRRGLVLCAAPLVVSQLLLRNRFPAYQDWADVATYTLAFLAGFVLACDTRFGVAIRTRGRFALVVGVGSSLAVGVLLVMSSFNPRIASSSDLPLFATYSLFWSLNIWAWCMAVLAMGLIWLNRSNAVMRYGAESALPVYIIHHPIVVILGSFIVAWDLPLPLRFLLLVSFAMAVTVLVYEFGIRRTNVTRFIFGLKPLGAESADRRAASSKVLSPALRPSGLER